MGKIIELIESSKFDVFVLSFHLSCLAGLIVALIFEFKLLLNTP